MTSSPHAIAALTEALGGPPPPSLEASDPCTLSHLAEAITAAQRQQEASLTAAIDHALRLIPRPLRGAVRKVIYG